MKVIKFDHELMKAIKRHVMMHYIVANMLKHKNYIEKLQSLQQIYREQKLYSFQARANILALSFNSNGNKDSQFIEYEINNAIKRQDFIVKYFENQIKIAHILEKHLSYSAKDGV